MVRRKMRLRVQIGHQVASSCDIKPSANPMRPDPRYEVIIYWSQEDRAFVAEVPELPGCASDGPTYEAALANVKVIIQDWIETAQEMGRPIPEPRGRLLYA